MFCTKCGNKLNDTAKFCTACGQKLEDVIQAPAYVPAPPAEPEMPVKTPIVQNSLDPMAPPVNQGRTVQNSLDPNAPPVEPEAPLIYADTDPDLAAQQKPKKKNKGLLIGIICGAVAVVAAVAVFLVISLNQKADLYAQAVDLMGQKNYTEAMAIFEELGSYKESEALLKELRDNQQAYDEAMELLNERKYEEAIEAFEELEDYADSADQAAYNVNYQKAKYLMDSAPAEDMEALSVILEDDRPIAIEGGSVAVMLYEAAAEIFTGLGDYSDAAGMAVQCYYGAGQVQLANGNWDQALAYMALMDEDNAAAFYAEYLTYCADASALEDLKTLLIELEGLDVAEGNELERAVLEPYADAHFADAGLQEQIMKYLEAVYIQQDVMFVTDTISGYLEYVRAAAMCAEVIDTLYADYGFLADDEELAAANVGWAEMNWAYYHIYGMLNDSLDGQEAFHVEGMYFVQMENDTEYDGTLVYSIICTLDGAVVYESEELRVDFTAGENPVIPLGILLGEVDFDAWSITYHGLENVKRDGTLLPHQE